jgi:hypothetical protein
LLSSNHCLKGSFLLNGEKMSPVEVKNRLVGPINLRSDVIEEIDPVASLSGVCFTCPATIVNYRRKPSARAVAEAVEKALKHDKEKHEGKGNVVVYVNIKRKEK